MEDIDKGLSFCSNHQGPSVRNGVNRHHLDFFEGTDSVTHGCMVAVRHAMPASCTR